MTIQWDDIDRIKHGDEEALAAKLDDAIRLTGEEKHRIDERAVEIVRDARKISKNKGLMETFLEEFGLSNKEGLASVSYTHLTLPTTSRV